jgi:hypothetical protein
MVVISMRLGGINSTVDACGDISKVPSTTSFLPDATVMVSLPPIVTVLPTGIVVSLLYTILPLHVIVLSSIYRKI